MTFTNFIRRDQTTWSGEDIPINWNKLAYAFWTVHGENGTPDTTFEIMQSICGNFTNIWNDADSYPEML